MDKRRLIDNLETADPGWPIWAELIELVESLEFDLEQSPYLGVYLASGSRLVFQVPAGGHRWPEWLPCYVPAVYGMKAADYPAAGGYADSFDGSPTEEGSVFASGGVNADLGFPEVSVPAGVYGFQSNSSGALFHLDTRLRVLYPHVESASLRVLDSLEEFTRKNIRQALENETWFRAYADLDATLMD